jgi:ethanolamine utilization protein EutA
MQKVADVMADALVAALTARPMPHDVEHLYLTDPIAELGHIDGDHVFRGRFRIHL